MKCISGTILVDRSENHEAISEHSSQVSQTGSGVCQRTYGVTCSFLARTHAENCRGLFNGHSQPLAESFVCFDLSSSRSLLRVEPGVQTLFGQQNPSHGIRTMVHAIARHVMSRKTTEPLPPLEQQRPQTFYKQLPFILPLYAS